MSISPNLPPVSQNANSSSSQLPETELANAQKKLAHLAISNAQNPPQTQTLEDIKAKIPPGLPFEEQVAMLEKLTADIFKKK